jgi:hypothetical protein
MILIERPNIILLIGLFSALTGYIFSYLYPENIIFKIWYFSVGILSSLVILLKLLIPDFIKSILDLLTNIPMLILFPGGGSNGGSSEVINILIGTIVLVLTSFFTFFTLVYFLLKKPQSIESAFYLIFFGIGVVFGFGVLKYHGSTNKSAADKWTIFIGVVTIITLFGTAIKPLIY